MPANVVTAEERWITNPDGSKRRRTTPLPPAVDADAPTYTRPTTHKAADAQAAERGLIDRTGTFQDAIEASARIAGLGSNYQIEWIEPEQSTVDEFLTGVMGGVIAKLNLSVSMPPSLPVYWLQAMLDDLQFLTSRQGKFTVAAHCLCGM